MVSGQFLVKLGALHPRKTVKLKTISKIKKNLKFVASNMSKCIRYLQDLVAK